MTIRYTPKSEGDFSHHPTPKSVFECHKRICQKREKGKALELWESYLFSRFEEWKRMSHRRHTVVKPDGERVSFVPGFVPVQGAIKKPTPRFSFEQILQTAIPLWPHFKDSYETAKAAEDLLTACHHRSIASLKRRGENEHPEKYQATVCFQVGIKHITGQQRVDRAQRIFEDLLQLEQAEAMFSGIFVSPGGFFDPAHPEREKDLLVDSFPYVASPEDEFQRHKDEGFTIFEVERLTLARNLFIKQSHLSGEPVTASFEEKFGKTEKKACAPQIDKISPNTAKRTVRDDKIGKKRDKPLGLARQTKSKQ
jgi:hypothetical protein